MISFCNTDGGVKPQPGQPVSAAAGFLGFLAMKTVMGGWVFAYPFPM